MRKKQPPFQPMDSRSTTADFGVELLFMLGGPDGTAGWSPEVNAVSSDVIVSSLREMAKALSMGMPLDVITQALRAVRVDAAELPRMADGTRAFPNYETGEVDLVKPEDIN